MEPWTKLYQRILNASVWRQPSDIRIVWITLLALKDKNGEVMGTEGWLAEQARVPDEACHKAIRIFLAPDKRSRTGANEGRKLEKIEGGWRVLNHHLYRDGLEIVREKWARQKAEQRAKAKEPWRIDRVEKKIKRLEAIEEEVKNERSERESE